jgi:hypothetical protein
MPLAGGKVRMGKPFVQAYKIKEHKVLPVLEEDAVIKDKYVFAYAVYKEESQEAEDQGENVVLINIVLAILYLKWKRM